MRRLLVIAVLLGVLTTSSASTFSGVIEVVDGKCNASIFVGRELLLDSGTRALNQPCEWFRCDPDEGEIEGKGCSPRSCPAKCVAVAKDPNGVYPSCCLSSCDCSERGRPETTTTTSG